MIQVFELMTSNVLTLRENASVGRARAEMKLGRVRHFPVVNRQGVLVGLVSNLDIAKALAVEGRGRSVPVREVMSKLLYTVSAETPAHEAARLMRQRKIGSLPVVSDDGMLVGILTASDFLQVAEKALSGRRLTRSRTA